MQKEVTAQHSGDILQINKVWLLDVIKVANEATKQGKALLSIFGTHSYNVTLDCARD